MNYKMHYDKLIERSRNRTLSGYVERHHIVPRCLEGSDDITNIAVLTPEEHFLAHLLLVKIYPNIPPLVNAAVIMTTHHTNIRENNKLFGWLRRRASEYRKQWLIENGHPKGFLGKKHTGEGLAKVKAAQAAIAEAKRIEIYAYNLDGSFYKRYETITECANDLGTNPSNVKYTADGKFSHCKKKQIRYEYNDTIPPYVKPKSIKGRERSKEHCENISKAKKGKKMPEGWAEKHSEAMKNYHKRKKEIKSQTGYSRIGKNNV